MDAGITGDGRFSTASNTSGPGAELTVDKQERYHGLDFVRAMAMMLGLSVHVNIFYFSEDRMFWSAEYHGDPLTSLLRFSYFNFACLFYMLAGFFALLVIGRKGLGFITWDRVKRIGIPFILGIVLLKPIIEVFWCVNTTYENTFVELNAWERLKHIIFWGTFSDKEFPLNLPLGHLWFIYFLIFYYAAHFLLRVRLKLFGSVHVNIDAAFQFFVTKKLGLVPLDTRGEWNSFLLYGSTIYLVCFFTAIENVSRLLQIIAGTTCPCVSLRS